MKRKLIAAILAEICALGAIFYLVNRADEPAVPTWETLPAATQPPATLPPTQPPTQPRQPEDPVEVLLHRLSLEQKVGQMFLARCPESGAAEAVVQYGLAGCCSSAGTLPEKRPAPCAQKSRAIRQRRRFPC